MHGNRCTYLPKASAGDWAFDAWEPMVTKIDVNAAARKSFLMSNWSVTIGALPVSKRFTPRK
jgi:hypothetical protein